MANRDVSEPESTKSQVLDQDQRFKEILEDVSVEDGALKKVFDTAPGEVGRQELIRERKSGN